MTIQKQSIHQRGRFLVLIVVALTATIFCIQAEAQSIFSNPITGTNPSSSNPYTIGQTVNSNLTVTGIGRSSGLSASSANDRYSATNFSTSSTIDTSKYFTFTLTPNTGSMINFVDFKYTGQASATGPTSFAFRSSADGFAGNIGSASVGGTTIDLSAAAYQNVTSSIEFRFYGYGASATTGTFSINDFTFDGTVPEPATILGGALLVGAAGWTQRRRLRGLFGTRTALAT